jgi:hypothetical protein
MQCCQWALSPLTSSGRQLVGICEQVSAIRAAGLSGMILKLHIFRQALPPGRSRVDGSSLYSEDWIVSS